MTPRKIDESHIEAKENHVAIPDDVIFTFRSQLANFARLGEGTKRDELVVVNRFRRDEAAFEI